MLGWFVFLFFQVRMRKMDNKLSFLNEPAPVCSWTGHRNHAARNRRILCLQGSTTANPMRLLGGGGGDRASLGVMEDSGIRAEGGATL